MLEMVKNMRIAIYTLALSGKKLEQENQKKELRIFCANYGWEIAAEFSDESQFDSLPSRPGFSALIAAASKREFDAVIVPELAQFALSVADLLILHQMIVNKMHFIARADGINTTTPMWGMVVPGVLASIAAVIQRERAQRGNGNARTKAAAACHSGQRVDIELARILQADGRGLREIARLMNVSRGALARALQAAGASNGENQDGNPNNHNVPAQPPDGPTPAGRGYGPHPAIAETRCNPE